MLDLVVIGHLLKEKILFPDGRELDPVLGGPAAYSSCAAARLGLKVGLVTEIGKDMPEDLLGVFQETGVDIRGIRRSVVTTSNLLIYRESGGKKLQFLRKAGDISLRNIPEEYLNAAFFLIAPIDYEVPEGLLQALHLKGKRLSMELSGFGGASSSNGGKIPERERLTFLQRITPYFEVIKAGQEDCRCLFGETPAEEVARKFLRWGAQVVAVTLGEGGAIIAGKDNCLRIPAFPTRAVDYTGAGDVWHAGFLAEYLTSGNLEKSGAAASAAASLAIAKSGGVVGERFPTHQEAADFVRQTRKILSSFKQVYA